MLSPSAWRRLGVLLVLFAAGPALAQAAPPRIGVGFDVSAALFGGDLSPDGPALGVRGRVALPVNADVSVAASLGASAHLFEGTRDARYVLNPQASLIVTLPGGGTARYVLGGFGGFIPFDGGGGPTVHGGIGWAVPLNATSLYVEANPSLILGEDATALLLTVRGGVIF
ncbi:hypothetical protein RQM47_10650 [Rubrivirga sp. S365]|uniref:Outer membrane protein beta-barrel domain-containing protein n=1 Tax=Rubrivirga litoralis TaxID=3075598 RepID=A0ABU3BT45_9BACT|nr:MULTISPECIES: hypothetical protein [unclassified Rubrivirga]MDT0632452.1 hypothetical protein [Rubrivirga sp. F394]MDT7857101.1 hypothetical protein [Rubrivirga sp. S365]